jgi:hypothetical protein
MIEYRSVRIIASGNVSGHIDEAIAVDYLSVKE